MVEGTVKVCSADRNDCPNGFHCSYDVLFRKHVCCGHPKRGKMMIKIEFSSMVVVVSMAFVYSNEKTFKYFDKTKSDEIVEMALSIRRDARKHNCSEILFEYLRNID